MEPKWNPHGTHTELIRNAHGMHDVPFLAID